ncbi:hypothetical protein BN8_00137 [Fibrisoma limi BUZ 3]|uniref:Uncharacterized protein n=1 Tax=Fibrisoma limi BUZ 3 TaxID=1185876 RepID=I2GBE8_9BACT|nr:hypothetical protein BN8_00137 [Fibrisoma limi BUZ 3]
MLLYQKGQSISPGIDWPFAFLSSGSYLVDNGLV